VRVLDDAAVDALCALAGEEPEAVLGDRFELGPAVSEGAMGVIHRAWDREAEREVAVKRLRRDDPELRERLAREAAALAAVVHPAVVRLVGCGEDFVAMEWLEGESLARRLGRGPLPIGEAIALARQLALGLAAVHAAGIAHRDVKPANVILRDGAGACLVDFGLALHPGAPTLTAAGAVVGTPGYLAPEQVRGGSSCGGEVGPAADVFALGCVLYECLAGRPAFEAEELEALYTQILLGEPGPLGVPVALEDLVARMLDKRSAGRPDAAAVASALAAVEEALTDAVPGGAPSQDLAPGTIVAGKYTVGAVLGRGGMGIVYAARHLDLGTQVALKVLAHGSGADDEARMLREARAAANLESEHALRVLDVGRLASGAPFIVMEQLRGIDLARRLDKSGPFALDEAVSHVLAACEAIAEAHALGIVHRDLKPSNLFLTARKDGTPLVKVLDFGISKLTRRLDAESHTALSITDPRAVIGSAAYMSPEQLRSARDVDARSDIWALGVVLFQLVTGRLPFRADGAAAMGAAIASAEPTPLTTLLPDALPALEAAVRRCLEKDPAARFADLAELAEALAPFSPRGDEAAERIARVLHHDVPPLPESARVEPDHTARAWDAGARAPSRRRIGFALFAIVAVLAVARALMRESAGARERVVLQASGVALAVAAQPPPTPPAVAAPSAVEPQPSAVEPPSATARPSVVVPRPARPAPRAKVDLRDPALDER
jgi:eukaryotic-like serine/threonine-protein kinase